MSEFKLFRHYQIVLVMIVVAACRCFPIGGINDTHQESLLSEISTETETSQDDNHESDHQIQTPGSQADEQELDAPSILLSESIVFEGVQFSYDPLVFNPVSPHIVAGQFMGEDYPPQATYPDHLQFDFEQNQPGEHFFEPTIRIYPIVEYEGISELAISTVQHLESVLNEKPEGGLFTSFPHMGLWGAVQLFTVQVRYLEFQNGMGVRYLSMFGQDVYPPDNQHLVYIFQGITDDRLHYISAVLPITHPSLPDDGNALIDDWETFYENWDALLNQVFSDLDKAEPESFVPDLAGFDAMLASIRFE